MSFLLVYTSNHLPPFVKAQNLTTPKLLLSLTDSELENRLRKNRVFQKFTLVEALKDYSWIEQAETSHPDIVLVQADEFASDSLAELLESNVLNNTEVLFISDGTPNPVIDEAMKKGVAYHLRQPVEMDFLESLFEELLADLHTTSDASEQVLTSNLNQFGLLLGSSKSMTKLYRVIRKAAPSNASVLIMGESGSGKELVAQTLHLMSDRRDKAFLSINCGAINDELIESELFGHRKGAFTGASEDRKGLFAQADGGTLFLDEITEMPPEQQVKLLRVLETGEYRKIGDETVSRSDVRVIAASNREASDAIAEETFREDLYFRLAQFPIRVPPLRKRDDDVEELARHFLAHRNAKENTSKKISSEAITHIVEHSWPGNVRELKHTIERAYILADDVIAKEHIVLEDGDAASSETQFPDNLSLEEIEKQVILKTLADNDERKKETAEQLGVSVKTLYNKLEKYEADSDD